MCFFLYRVLVVDVVVITKIVLFFSGGNNICARKDYLLGCELCTDGSFKHLVTSKKIITELNEFFNTR